MEQRTMRQIGEWAEKSPLHKMMNAVVKELAAEFFPNKYANTTWKHSDAQTKKGAASDAGTADWAMFNKQNKPVMLLETKSTKGGEYRSFTPSDIVRGKVQRRHRREVTVTERKSDRVGNKKKGSMQLQRMIDKKIPSYVAMVVTESHGDQNAAYGIQLSTVFAMGRASRTFSKKATNFTIKQDAALASVMDVLEYLQPQTKKTTKGDVVAFDSSTGLFKKEEGNKYLVSDTPKAGYFPSFAGVATSRKLYGVAPFGVPFLVGGQGGLASAKKQLLKNQLFRDTMRTGMLSEIQRIRTGISTQRINQRASSKSPIWTNTTFGNELSKITGKEKKAATTVNVLADVPELKQGMKIQANKTSVATVNRLANNYGLHVMPKAKKRPGTEVRVKGSAKHKAYTRGKAN